MTTKPSKLFHQYQHETAEAQEDEIRCNVCAQPYSLEEGEGEYYCDSYHGYTTAPDVAIEILLYDLNSIKFSESPFADEPETALSKNQIFTLLLVHLERLIDEHDMGDVMADILIELGASLTADEMIRRSKKTILPPANDIDSVDEVAE